MKDVSISDMLLKLCDLLFSGIYRGKQMEHLSEKGEQFLNQNDAVFIEIHIQSCVSDFLKWAHLSEFFVSIN